MAAFPMHPSTSTWTGQYALSASTNTFGWWADYPVTAAVYRAVEPAMSVAAWCRVQLARLARPGPAPEPAVVAWDGSPAVALSVPREHRLKVGTRRRART